MQPISRRRLLGTAAVVLPLAYATEGCQYFSPQEADKALQQAIQVVQGVVGALANVMPEIGIILGSGGSTVLDRLKGYSDAIQAGLSTLGTLTSSTSTTAQTTIQTITKDLDAFVGAAISALQLVPQNGTVTAVIAGLTAAQALIPVLLQLVGLVIPQPTPTPAPSGRMAAPMAQPFVVPMTPEQLRAWSLVQSLAAKKR